MESPDLGCFRADRALKGIEGDFQVQAERADTGEGSAAGAVSYRISFPQVRRLLDAIETVAAVKVTFLDASGTPSRLEESGSLVAHEGARPCLGVSTLQQVMGHPKPVLYHTQPPGLAVAQPFMTGGRLAGFINASAFCLDEPDEKRRAALGGRYIVESWWEASGPEMTCPRLGFDWLDAVTDLLEAATAELTLMAAGGQPCEPAAGDSTTPLSWTVWSLLNEISAEGQNGEALAEATKAREQMEALYDSTQYGILMLDKDRKIVAANKRFGESFGVSADAFIGVSGNWLRRWAVKHARDPARVSRMIDELLASNDAIVEDEIEILTPNHMILRLFSAPVKSKTDEMIGRLFMFRDITQFRQARHDMIGSEKMSAIGRLAAGLAHGLNNILAGVVTYADYALEQGNPEKIREALKMSLSAAEKASQLVNKLLVVSGASESQRQDVELHVELERLLDSLAEDFQRDDVRIHRLLEPVPRVNVDPLQIQEALRNILTNARQAIGREGTVTARTETDWDNGYVRVTISDNGPGIPSDMLERVFDPFFTTRGVVSGGADTAAAGLGLSLTKGIVEKHGGRVSATNVLPHGTAFVVELPLAGVSSEQPPEPSIY